MSVQTQADFAAQGVELLGALDLYIKGCSAVVHLVGEATGECPPAGVARAKLQEYPQLLDRVPSLRPACELDDPGISYTQWEALLAIAHGVKLVPAFPEAATQAGKEEGYERDAAEAGLQGLHSNRIRETSVQWVTFRSRDHLIIECLRAVHDILQASSTTSDAGWEIPDPASPGGITTIEPLSATEFDPSDTRHDLRVGLGPSLTTLRDEQYMTRSLHVSRVVDSLRQLRDSRSADAYNELEVFWIAGRSGSGKSVVLLQAMERLVRDGLSVVWLYDNAARLQPLLQQMLPARGSAGVASPDFIFVDDIYSPRSQTSLDLDAINRVFSSDPHHRWPIIVTCGPPEFVKHFKRDAGRDCVREWGLPPIGREEAEDLLAWFRDRSPGRVGEPGQAFQDAMNDDDGLMVSMAFEILVTSRHGDLAAFARNFHDRLKNTELVEALLVPLALNRLYIMSPVSWLTVDQRERLEVLNLAMDFSIDVGSDDRAYLRLTHPHISNVIYRAIRPNDSPHAFANDLAVALSRALASDLDTFRYLLRLLAEGHERLEDIDMEHLVEQIAPAWNQSDGLAGLNDAWALADIRTSWACWHARCPELHLEHRLGNESLLDAAREAMGSCVGGFAWPIFWTRLHTSFPSAPGPVLDACEWVYSVAALSHPTWSRIWETLWKLGQDDDPRIDQALSLRLDQLAWGWLPPHADQVDWHYVWQKLLRTRRPESAVEHMRVQERGWSWLTGEFGLPEGQASDTNFREDHPGWPYVFEDLLAEDSWRPSIDRRELLALGLRWLDGRSGHASWTYMWQALIHEPDLPVGFTRQDLWHRGHDWLEGREEHPSWPHAWRGLVESSDLVGPDLCLALYRRGFSWLTGREGTTGWAQVWTTLMAEHAHAADVDRHEMIAAGDAWLAQYRDTAEWSFVWKQLFLESRRDETAPVDRQRVLALGAKWLKENGSRKGWPFVWPLLVTASDLPDSINLEALLALGLEWLAGREDEDGYAHVWHALASACRDAPSIDRRKLLLAGHTWLAGREQQEGWGRIWQLLVAETRKLTDQDQPLPEVDRGLLINSGIDLLESNPMDWTYIWEYLVGDEDVTPEIWRVLIAEGQRWLRCHTDRSDWTRVWEKLRDIADLSPDMHAEVLLMGFSWLDGRESQADWSYVWSHLLGLDELPNGVTRMDLCAKGLDWLDAHSTHKSWTYIWGPLLEVSLKWPAQIDHEMLIEHGVTWLRAHFDHPSSPPMAARLVSLTLRPESLDDLAGWLAEWLDEASDQATVQVTSQHLLTDRSWTSRPGHGAGYRRLLKWLQRREELIEQLRRLHADRHRIWGAVTADVKGGLIVALDGIAIPAFLPGSQIDIRKVELPRDHIGRRYEVVILSIDEDRLSAVVSRRAVLEEDLDAQIATELAALQVGQIVEGRVVNVGEKLGLFVKLKYVTGLLHKSELSWERYEQVTDFGRIGDSIRVKVLRLDVDAGKVSFGLKQIEDPEGPWGRIERVLSVGSWLEGVVTSLVPYGAFVKLDGYSLSGLVHSSELSWMRYVGDPSAFVSVGDRVTVKVQAIDRANSRLGFSLRLTQPNPWPGIAATLPVGSIVDGHVVEIDGASAFIEVIPGVHGRLHADHLSWTARRTQPADVMDVGDRLRCQVIKVDADKRRLWLGLKQLTPNPWLEKLPARYPAGRILTGRIQAIVDFGAFVELEPDLVGLLHVSQIAEPRSTETLAVGQEIEVRVLSIVPEKHVIKLSTQGV